MIHSTQHIIEMLEATIKDLQLFDDRPKEEQTAKSRNNIVSYMSEYLDSQIIEST